MIGISVQISLYPLGQADLAPAIQRVLNALSARGLPYQVGSMSTVTWGDDEVVFPALREAFVQAAELGPAVMTMTASNACPRPQPSDEETSRV